MEEEAETPSPLRRRILLWLLLLVVLAVAGYTQLTVFVIQPIGAVPEGETLVLRRTGKMQFIDSADAMCEREMGQVNLLFRGAILGAIGRDAKVLARLPYSEILYSISTRGKKYDR